MALVRSDRRARLELREQAEAGQALILEQQQIGQILQEIKGLTSQVQEQNIALDGLKGQVRDLRSNLMGAGDEGETRWGRLPQAEQKIADLQLEIRRLDGELEALKKTQATGLASAAAYWNSARIIGHVMTACGGGLVVAIADQVLRTVVK